MKSPKLSVIIPVYNTENYLAACLDSVVGQSWDNLEVLIVDDCTPDHAMKIAQEYAERYPFIRILHHPENRGLFRARITGMQAMTGDYFAFLDSDDTVTLDYYRLMIKKAMATGADLVAGDFIEVMESGEMYYPNRIFQQTELDLKGPEILDFLSKILSEEYFVISASSGEEALQILEKNNIDLIISDVMMEEMDGFELCGKIKSNINISHVPVILLTAKTDTESKIKGLEAGADAYIEKPFSPFHLKAQLLNLLKKRESQQKTYASTPLSDLHSAVHNKLDEEFMNKCTEIIQNNIEDSEFSVNTLAQELGMSRTSVFTKIKGIIGMTPNDFIKVTRLKKACKMMVEGEYRVTEIGFLVGFSSSSYFAKCFQKQFGVLPKDFVS